MAKEEKVLIVDDELFSREYFQKILEKIDCEVRTFPTGSDGLNAFKESFYDLVILDVRLPDADGIEILRQIKEINRLTPVIIVTAYGTVENAVQAMKLGAFDFLMKPFQETEKVLITIKNAIYQGKLEKENHQGVFNTKILDNVKFFSDYKGRPQKIVIARSEATRLRAVAPIITTDS